MTDFEHDEMVARSRVPRWGFLISTAFAAITTPVFIGTKAGGLLGFHSSSTLGACVGVGLGVFTLLKAFPRFWVVVPQTTAFVTTNQFAPSGSNPNIPYGPGGHPSFPWEMRQESGNISIDVMTVSVREEVPTKGSKMVADVMMQFKFDLREIVRVVGIDVTTIEQGLVAEINEWLSNELAQMVGEEIRLNIIPIRKKLEEEFMRTRAADLLVKYAVRVVSFQVASIDFPPKVQEARDTLDELKSLNESLHILLGYESTKALVAAIAKGDVKAVDVARAREDFLASSGNVVKEVRRIDATGLENASPGAGIAGGLLGADKGSSK